MAEVPSARDRDADVLEHLLLRLCGCIGKLQAALEESDQLARAGERVGYESAYRVLRRAVSQVLELADAG